MRRLLSCSLVLGVAFTLLSVSRPAAGAVQPPAAPPPAAPPQTVRLGIADKDPFVFTWLDGADGSVHTDTATATQVHDLFANTAWIFLDDGRLIIGKGQALDNLKEIVTLHYAHNDKLTFYL